MSSYFLTDSILPVLPSTNTTPSPMISSLTSFPSFADNPGILDSMGNAA
eukprot:CAMPEP_0170193564 /NCGR_PEP_ID=MMETSP0040_2-20121228/57127_1 /TAXON_ID=641309 /ORGANISM="Lotharella oceanica, Strain CCMP622" /LENGTH=48 /DNA_ID= /DNA_START= /DNA_END= /DNA_ORIENTATION=